MPDPRKVLVWRNGFEEWEAADTVRELAEQLFRPPPLKPNAPAIHPAEEPRIREPAVTHIEPKQRLNIDADRLRRAEALAEQLMRGPSFRQRLILFLKVAFYLAVLGLLVFLFLAARLDLMCYVSPGQQRWSNWLQRGCSEPRSIPWISLFGMALIGLMVWWPLVRARIKKGRSSSRA
jgi:hypothetical protein